MRHGADLVFKDRQVYSMRNLLRLDDRYQLRLPWRAARMELAEQRQDRQGAQYFRVTGFA